MTVSWKVESTASGHEEAFAAAMLSVTSCRASRDPDNELSGPPTNLCRLTDDLAQDVGEDAAVLVVIDLDGRVDAQDERDVLDLTVGALDFEHDDLARLDVVVDAAQGIGFRAVELEAGSVYAISEAKREN